MMERLPRPSDPPPRCTLKYRADDRRDCNHGRRTAALRITEARDHRGPPASGIVPRIPSTVPGFCVWISTLRRCPLPAHACPVTHICLVAERRAIMVGARSIALGDTPR
jgi:hypothetical protein